MTSAEGMLQSQRVLILAPTGRDAALTRDCLVQASIEAEVCRDLQGLQRGIEEGTGVILIAEEALAASGLAQLAATLSKQPPWSDLPVMLLTRYGANSSLVVEALQKLSNVELLERPIRPAALLSSVRSSLRARLRQYQVGSHLLQQQRTNAQLAESIRERDRVAEALRDADRRKDEFLATLAHELRNPLSPICNALQILRLTTGDSPSAGEICELMARQVSHLVRLVDDLMEVSRITRGNVELRKAPAELAAIVRAAVEVSRPIVEASGHQLFITIPPDPLIVEVDSMRLAQVISNLLNNSAKYMNEGGKIWLTAFQEHQELVISVRDEGVGIHADMLPHIFTMFTQIDRSKRQAQGGLGIGLTLVRSLVEMHGGRVAAFSDGLDKGSEFVVRIPIPTQRNSSPAPPLSSNESPAALPKRRVLIVDDNRDAANTLSRLLRLLGMETTVAHDGPAALEILPQFRPAIVLLDIGMPNMNGYEVACRIRAQPEWGRLTLVALTGWGQEEDRRLAREAGFDHHLLKPANIGALEELFQLDGAANISS